MSGSSRLWKASRAPTCEWPLRAGGCSGLTYVLELVDEEAQEDEKVVDEHGLKVFIPKRLVRVPGRHQRWSTRAG